MKLRVGDAVGKFVITYLCPHVEIYLYKGERVSVQCPHSRCIRVGDVDNVYTCTQRDKICYKCKDITYVEE